jgi:hypothetical protein
LVPANQVTTVKSIATLAALAFDYEFAGGISLSELTVAISSDETKFVDPGANKGLDMTIEVDTVCDVRSSTVGSSDTVTGDLTTGVNSLQVWAEATGPKRLLRVDWISSKTPACYLQLFAINSPPDGTIPLVQFPINTDVNGVVVQKVSLGTGGFIPLSGQSSATLENVKKGCTLAVSTTSGVLTIIADSSAAIRAIWGDATRLTA